MNLALASPQLFSKLEGKAVEGREGVQEGEEGEQ